MEPVTAPEQQTERNTTEIVVPVQEEAGEQQQQVEQRQRQDRLHDQELEYRWKERELIEKNRKFLLTTNTVLEEERIQIGQTLRRNLAVNEDMGNRGKSGELEKESAKARRRRQKEYSQMREQYGDRVSMETVYLKHDLERYWAERENTGVQWEKKGADIRALADRVELSPEMMESARQKGGMSYPDLPRLLRTRDALRHVIDNGYNLEDKSLSPEQKPKLAVGVQVYPQLNLAIRRLLYEHSIDMRGRYFNKEDYVLDEQGELHRATQEPPSGENMDIQSESMRQLFERNLSLGELAGANEIGDFRKTLSAAMKQEGERQDLTLSDETKEALREEIEREKEAYRGRKREKLTQLKELAAKTTLEEKAKRAAEKLWEEIAGLDDIIMEKEARIRAMENKIQELKRKYEAESEGEREQSQEEGIEMEDLEKVIWAEDISKLKLHLTIEKSDDVYDQALRQSARMERMLRVVGGDKKPESMLTVAMRLELAGKYGLTEYEEGLSLGPKSEQELERERALVEEDNVRQVQANRNAEEDRQRGREEKRLDELENILGERSIEEMTEQERREYGELAERLNGRQNRARKLRVRHLELWLAENMPELKNALDIENMEGLDSTEAEVSREEANAERGDRLYDTLLWQGRIESTLRVILGGEKNMERFPLLNSFLSAHSHLMTGEDVLVQIMTQPALLNEIEQNFKDGEMKELFLNTAQNLGSLTSTGAGVLGEFASAVGMSESVTGGLGTLGGVGDTVYHGVDAVKQALAAHEARMRGKDLSAFEQEITKEETGSEEEADLMKNLVRTGTRTAGTDFVLHTEKSVTDGLRAVSSILSMAGVSAVVGVVTSWVTKLTDIAFSIAGKREKRESRKLHIRERFDSIFKTIREKEQFRGISSRDLKHTVLRFAGVSTGKRSEAALRSLTIESYRLLTPGRLRGKREEFRKKMLEKFHIKEEDGNEGATRERLKDLLTKLGVSGGQASNPIQAVKGIRERARVRREQGKGNFLKRGIYRLKKFVAWEE